MDVDLIEKFSKVLKEKWVETCYSDEDISRNAELPFFERMDCKILARKIWLYLQRKHPTKRDFIKTVSRNLYNKSKKYDILQYGLKKVCKHVANVLSKIPNKADLELGNEQNIIDVEIELRQKYRTHCCEDLDCTDNAERDDFCNSRIVYIREINAYAFVNLRKYTYDPKLDEYELDQTIKYELIDYCPFCGNNLKAIRIHSDKEQELIIDAINKWRNCGIAFQGEGEFQEDPITYYGINFYDSIDKIVDILVDKYAQFCSKYGIDENGKLSSKGVFITVEKLFKLYEKHDIYSNWWFFINRPDSQTTEIEYFKNKIQDKLEFTEDEKFELGFILHDVFVKLFHKPQYFEELRGADL